MRIDTLQARRGVKFVAMISLGELDALLELRSRDAQHYTNLLKYSSIYLNTDNFRLTLSSSWDCLPQNSSRLPNPIMDRALPLSSPSDLYILDEHQVQSLIASFWRTGANASADETLDAARIFFKPLVSVKEGAPIERLVLHIAGFDEDHIPAVDQEAWGPGQ